MRYILLSCAILAGASARADIRDDIKRIGEDAKTIAETIRDDVRSGLTELVPPRSNCGSNGQRHCNFRERPLAKCDLGLLTHPFDICFKPRNDDRAENITRGGSAGPKEMARELWELAKDLHEAFTGRDIKAGMIKDLIEELKPAASAISDAIRARRFDKAALARIAKSIDVEALQRILEETPKLVAAYGSLRAAGFDTLTMGDSIGIGLIRGIQGEAGISLDTRQRRVGAAYAARTDSKGIQAFAGNDVVFSAFDTTQNCDIAGTAYGYGVSVDVKAGFGLVIWYSGEVANFGEFIGFSTAIGAGSIGGGFAGLKSRNRDLSQKRARRSPKTMRLGDGRGGASARSGAGAGTCA